ncbi:DUF3253 domain-containing protein [Gillisia marina]|uniref:DUF3253 domain-containing protein n=1 Tax=Gillisia marina TaxID=1167637 RepID=UPI00029A4A27|nr:DUF3253 domain-containing protein [Gillisia marina]
MIDKRITKLIKASHLKFANERASDKTYCPSEVARELFPNEWRDKMDLVRIVADDLVKSGHLLVLQKGEIKLELPSKLVGPIRLRKKGV